MAPHKELLLDLVAYVRSIQPRKRQDHTLSPGSVLLEDEEAQAFPGVHLAPEEEVWVRVERVGEPEAPALPDHLRPVVEGAVDLAGNRPLVRPYPTFESGEVFQPSSQEETQAPTPEPEADQQAAPVASGDPVENTEPMTQALPALPSSQEWEALAQEAGAWIEGPWQDWSARVTLARKSNEFYQRLFHVMTSLKLDGAAETQEIVCGMGTVSWKVGTRSIHHPLLLQACEIVMLDGVEGVLEVRPASAAPDTSLDMFSQVGAPTVGVARKWVEEQDLADDLDINPFEPSSFQGLLEGLVSRLDPTGAVVEAVDLPGAQLQVDCHWVFFLRDRPNDRLWRDLDAWEKVLADLQDEQAIPLFLRAMVDKSVHPPAKTTPVAWRGSEPLGVVEQAQEVRSLYFPLPYNTEQAQIAQHLEDGFGAIVQGPPGTGKSHTIANVIAHYLAHGKRILVAASSAAALEVVREKLPPQIRDLAAALLSSDAQGLADFEKSLGEIEHRLANFNPSESQARVAHLEGQLESLHAAIADLDKRIEALASSHLEWVEVDGQRLLLSEVARRVAQMGAPSFSLPGKVPAVLEESSIQAVEKARRLIQALGDRLADPDVQGTLPQALPSPDQVQDYCKASASLARIAKDRQDQSLATPLPSPPSPDLKEKLMEVLDAWAEAAGHVHEFLEENDQGWTRQCLDKVASLPDTDPVVERLRGLSRNLEKCFQDCRALDGRVSLNPNKWLTNAPAAQQAREALARLAEGEPAFSWWQAPFRKEAQAILNEVEVDAQPPESAKEWGLVSHRLHHFRQGRRLFRQWNSQVKAMELPHALPWTPQVSSVMRRGLACARACLMAREIKNGLATQLDDLIDQSFQAHPGLGSQSDLPPAQQKELVIASFQALEEEGDARARLGQWESALHALEQSGPFGRRVVAKARQVDLDKALHYWKGVGRDLEMSRHSQTALEEIQACIRQVEQDGFSQWPQGWLDLGSGKPHPISEDWQEGWRHRAYSQCLEGMPSGRQIESLLANRHELVVRLAGYITELSSEKAWAGLVENATPDTRRALKEYAGAVRRQGRGQGRRAQRHRATARRAMEKAFAAIGCWVMPHGRVCESMPPHLGLFDLVIIDEASQSDIQALPTLLRGKQLLIVGDDKQVSPEAVGVSEDSILKALNNELARQPYRSHMTQDRSLYDLFGSVFATRDIMLREHFRSAEAIIAYSNRHYYHGKILPMRVPRATERLDPPLIDALVRNGVYRNDINMGEAEWIAEEIERLVNDPAFEGKSIGVVTLTSNDKQSIAIHNALDSRVPVHAWVAHQITVGPPPVFQGKERDIMFVSMVWDGRNRRSGANRTPMFEKRFNVAMSRGRDRVYLVRSNEDRPFRPGSLLAEVIEHFQNPIPERPDHGPQTNFERDLAQRLEALGYRVIHHPGGKSLGLDMVVEDDFGNRIALQCDGDRSPGTGASWRQQMRQHRSLERSGWSVWRGFYADFNQDPDAFMEKVCQALADAGVGKSNPEKNGRLEQVQHWVVGDRIEATEEEVEELESSWPQDPAQWPQDKDLLMAMCDSPFEKDVLKALLSRGFRVHPQYPLGGYRIDFVVQGPDGSRLAIECDGDTFHGMDKYEADKARQAWLEETGSLTFWRCWYSDWRARRASCLEDMWRALGQAGVKPFQ